MTESACPFCRGVMAGAAGAGVRAAVPTQRLGRAAIFAFSASLAAAGCSDDGSTMALYGAPADVVQPTDNASTDSTATDTPTADQPTPQDAPDAARADAAMDGAATDGATTDRGPSDDGGPVPLYGAPADVVQPRDTGPQDDGGAMALYGLPPPDAGADGAIGVRYGTPAIPADYELV